MKSDIRHFIFSFIINGIFWMLLILDKHYLYSGEVWAWIQVIWFVLAPVYTLLRVFNAETRQPFLLGLVSSLLVALLFRFVF